MNKLDLINKSDLYKTDKSKRSWGIAILISLDQLVNTIFFGYPDETISSRAFREDIKWLESLINTLFFFDYQDTAAGRIRHCELAYYGELAQEHISLKRIF